jgi:hypothetical protein
MRRTRLGVSFRTGAPVEPGELRAAERVLARLVALAFAQDHPELFRRARSDLEDPASLAAAASDDATAGAAAARATTESSAGAPSHARDADTRMPE